VRVAVCGLCRLRGRRERFFTMKAICKSRQEAQGAGEERQRYNPAEIEPSGRRDGDADAALYAAEGHDSAKKKFYCLEMLRIPAGSCTWGMCGTTRSATRWRDLCGCAGTNVLHPMGWDAFGLPAENAALKNNTPPREWTLANIAAMRRQMQRMGFSYDWATEVTTCLPEYYRWNQWFFLKMYERGAGVSQEEQGELVSGGARRCWRMSK